MRVAEEKEALATLAQVTIGPLKSASTIVGAQVPYEPRITMDGYKPVGLGQPRETQDIGPTPSANAAGPVQVAIPHDGQSSCFSDPLDAAIRIPPAQQIAQIDKPLC